MRILVLLVAAASMLLGGCAISGTIVDRSKLEIPLTRIRLAEHPRLKILYNGVVREVSLKAVRSMRLVPANSVTFGRELYYGAELTMRDGTTLSSPKGSNASVYVCIQNTLNGRNRREKVVVGLEQIHQINVK